MAKVKIFEIPPDRSLFGKLGARSRAFPMVVTELVDNSLDSWTSMPTGARKGKELKIEINAEGKKAKNPYFVIKDNAGGMTDKELENALKVAHSEKAGNAKFLGRYGFGLKSACMYIGAEFEIFTRSYKEPKVVHFVRFDRDHFEKQDGDKWTVAAKELSLQEAGEAEVYFPDGHGTEIRVKNEKYVSANKAGIERRLSRIFGPRLTKRPGAPKIPGYRLPYDEMNLVFNNDPVYASGPFYEPYIAPSKSELEELGEEEQERGKQSSPALAPKRLSKIEKIPAKAVKGKKVSGFAAIIDRGMGHNNEYGFDLIKNGRVIEMNALDKDKVKGDDEYHALIGLPARNHYARIAGQIFLDDGGWQTDHQKTEFLKDDEDASWRDLAKHVAEHVEPLLKISSELQEPQRKEKQAQSKQEKGISDVFEPSIPKIRNSVQKAARKGNLGRVLADLDKAPPKPVEKKATPKPNISNTKIVYSRPVIEYEYNGRGAPIFTYSSKASGNGVVFKVKINFDHPFLKKWESGERKAIAEFVAADAYAAFALKGKGLSSYDDFLKIRETMLSDLKDKL